MTAPTRGGRILELFFTSNPPHIDSVEVISGLGDHDIVQVEVSVTP